MRSITFSGLEPESRPLDNIDRILLLFFFFSARASLGLGPSAEAALLPEGVPAPAAFLPGLTLRPSCSGGYTESPAVATSAAGSVVAFGGSSTRTLPPDGAVEEDIA